MYRQLQSLQKLADHTRNRRPYIVDYLAAGNAEEEHVRPWTPVVAQAMKKGQTAAIPQDDGRFFLIGPSEDPKAQPPLPEDDDPMPLLTAFDSAQLPDKRLQALLSAQPDDLAAGGSLNADLNATRPPVAGSEKGVGLVLELTRQRNRAAALFKKAMQAKANHGTQLVLARYLCQCGLLKEPTGRCCAS